jgi:hypothetical protein
MITILEMMGTSAEIMLLSLASMQMPGAAEKLFAAAQVFYKK